LALSIRAGADLLPAQVLVVYNSQSSGAQSIVDAYLQAHPQIPAANVLDLNDVTIAGTADISYANYIARVRNPVRDYLDLAGGPDANSIVSILLVRGLPHRIQDTDNPTVGDNPLGLQSEFVDGDATAACLDAEMVLLWQELDSGEGGGTMDSHADNLIDNPYHQSLSDIQSFSRSSIKTQKTLLNTSNIAWRLGGSGPNRLTPGDMYLVSRLDGNSTADAIALINRAVNLVANRTYARIVLDEDGQDLDNAALFNPPLFYAGNDYEETRDLMQANGWRVVYDNTGDFIESSELTRPVILYASYGENHSPNPPGSGTYISGFNFPPGAVFNTMESYNGRGFNGLGTLFSQEQVADFVAAGGTFGVGNVWEPFAFSLPDNEFLASGLWLNGMTWAEAAWSSIPGLSWMQLVIGDPLASVTVVDQPADLDADGDVDGDDQALLEDCATAPALAQTDSNCQDADLDVDQDVDQDDSGLVQRCRSGEDVQADPACLD
jgi:hypothetical protein